MTALPVPWIFLAVALVGAGFTYNAHRPQRALAPLVTGSFFAGWLTSELAWHHLGWQLLATVAFAAAGALSAWPGWLGLGISLVSWAGLYALVRQGNAAGPTVEEGLRRGLGERYAGEIAAELRAGLGRPLPPGRRLVPFRLSDPEVHRVADLVYAPEHGFRGKLDLWLPRTGVPGAPVLFQIHGGAWVLSQKRHQALPLMLHMARAGWVCVSANYRLSPKATFPDHLVDLKRALAWVRENIAEHGGDPDLVCVTGGSAGGHLSALMALTANDPEYQPGFESVDTSLSAAVPFYGVYDFTDEYERHQHRGLGGLVERLVMKKSLAEHREDWRRASPMHRVHEGAPPFFVVHGTHDALTPVEEAREFVERLRAVSREPVCYAEIPGAQHAFEVFHSARTTHVVRGVERYLAWVVSRQRARAAGAPDPPLAADLRTGTA